MFLSYFSFFFIQCIPCLDSFFTSQFHLCRLTKSNGAFIFSFPLHSFLLASIATDWNERILDAFNLVVEIAR
jgi:hypothetical protein